MKALAGRFACNRGALLGLLILAFLLLLALFADLIAPTDPWDTVGAPFIPPLTDGFFLGTDSLGRDVWAGIVHGARVSLLIGLAVSFLALLIGVTIGHIAGFFGGVLDDALMRFTELFQTIPAFLFALILVATLQPSLFSLVLAITLVSWPPVARLVRAEILSLREQEFIDAAKLSGVSGFNVMFREVLPNCASPIIVMGSLMVATAILTESGVSFLGLGDPNLMSWGYMVGAARSSMRIAWWTGFFPGLAVFLSVLAVNMAGEGLNDALNPRFYRRGSEK